MLLADLANSIPDARIAGENAADVRGLSHDSRAANPGDLFACLVGEKFDGHRFAAEAVARGAVALLADVDHASNLPATVPAIMVRDTRRALPGIAAAINGFPSRSLKLVGITGTNGKTTTTFMVASILRAAGMKSGTIGTLGAELMGESLPSERTTPEADQLQGLLAEMRARGATAVAMEVSSHALAQYRTDGCEFDAAAFTNLTQDHLDYHETMEAYFRSKLRLFTDYSAASQKRFAASVNIDDPYGLRIAAATCGHPVTYGIHNPAAVRASDVRTDAGHVSFKATMPAGFLHNSQATVAIRLNIGGSFQAYNALAAIGVGIGLGIDPETIAQGLADLKSVPGRFESVPTGRGFHVIVDYAHSPDGIENLVASARRLNPNRLIILFGCGGDRDRTKRPIMGRLAAMNTEIAIVTSDNPRSEDPNAIIEEVVSGMGDSRAQVIVEPDRRAAIERAIHEARDGDIVLLAGKGHEDYQVVGDQVLPFDDRKIAREILGTA